MFPAARLVHLGECSVAAENDNRRRALPAPEKHVSPAGLDRVEERPVARELGLDLTGSFIDVLMHDRWTHAGLP